MKRIRTRFPQLKTLEKKIFLLHKSGKIAIISLTWKKPANASHIVRSWSEWVDMKKAITIEIRKQNRLISYTVSDSSLEMK